MRILKVKDCDVLLDDGDFVRFCRLKWKIRSTKDKTAGKYICCNKRVWIQSEQRFRRKTIYLHRAIVCPPYGLDLPTNIEVHHRNGNELDNQRNNLEKLVREEHNKLTRIRIENGD
jgi:hypothetical protein